jgi:putative ABC transport system permease protein
MIRVFLQRLRALFLKRRLEREMEDEFRSHLELHIEDNVRLGMSPLEARTAALRQFGGVERIKEDYRDRRGLPIIETTIQDLRYGARMLARSPVTTIVALLSLTLGIGANVAIFSLVDAVLLRPLPFAEPGRLMTVWMDASRNGFARGNVAPATYLDVRDQNRVFEGVAALVWGTASITGDGQPEQADYHSVTPNLFTILGVTPRLGRTLQDADAVSGATRTVLLSYGLWQRRYAGDPEIAGKTILINGSDTVVVGVMPRNFQILGNGVDLWTPLTFDAGAHTVRGVNYLEVVARLKRGVTETSAQADLDIISRGIESQYPKEAAGTGRYLVVESLHHQLSGDSKPALFVLLAAVACMLLIACVNLANLQLSRGASRHREIAVRAAVGASRGRLVRQMLTESVLLATLGGASGILLARWCLTFLKQLVPDSMSQLAGVTINLPLIGYTVGLSFVTALLFGLFPALRTTAVNLGEALKQAGGHRLRAGDHRLRRALVISEMALAIVLLIAAGLLARSFVRLRGQDLGFRSENTTVLRTRLPESKYSNRDKRAQWYTQVLDRVKALPGVSDAAYTSAAPLRWKGGSTGVAVEGGAQQSDFGALHRVISPDYFRALGIPLMSGRTFDERDGPEAPQVAIVNQTMARQLWQGANPIGKRFKLSGDQGKNWLTVVGVAGDARQMGIAAPTKAEMYFPYWQDPAAWCAPRDLVVHTARGQSGRLLPSIKDAVWAVDSQQPISRIQTMDDLVDSELGNQRIGTTLIIVLAALAVLLSMIGIYGVLSFAVSQRTQEIGVRVALGATRGDILRGILIEGAKMVLTGAAIGLVASFLLTRLLANLLFGIGTRDPLTFLGSTGLLLLVSLFACYIPAWRATRVDPLTAIRCE